MKFRVDRFGDGVGEERQRLEVVELRTFDRVDAAHRLHEPRLARLAKTRYADLLTWRKEQGDL